MTLNASAIFSAVTSHAKETGIFDRVCGHEAKNPPGNGVSAEVFAGVIEPIRGSGLASTSGRLELTIRVRLNGNQEPLDDVELKLLKATDELFAKYSGDFELGGLIRNVDLLGIYGMPLRAQTGYLEHSGKFFRIMTITLPLIINDIWSQSA